MKKVSLLLVLILSLSSCQMGVGINPCRQDAKPWQKYCQVSGLNQNTQNQNTTKASSPSEDPSQIFVSPEPSSSITKSPVPQEPIQLSEQKVSSPSPENPKPTSLPSVQPIEVLQPIDYKLVLGPSRYEFSGPNESTQLVFFIKDTQGNVLNPADFNLQWKSERPDLFTVSNKGEVQTTIQANSGYTTISVTDLDTGKTASMDVVIGRGGGGGGGNSTPTTVQNTINLNMPTINQRFVPGQTIPLSSNFTTSDAQIIAGFKVIFRDENGTQIAESTTANALGNNTHQVITKWTTASIGQHTVTSELQDEQGQVLATTSTHPIEVSIFGITSYYVNTTTDKIYVVNLTDGSTIDQTDIPGAGVGFPSPGGTIDALAKHPTNNLVYYEGRGSGNNKLYYWNPAEGTTATAHHYVGDILETVSGTRRNISMMGFSPANQKLYGFGITGGASELFEININTGAATLITLNPVAGTTTPTSSGGDLAVNKEGTLYLSTSNRIYEIKLTSATTASIELLGNLVRQDNGASVGSVSSIGFDALNQAHVMTSSGSKIRLYRFDAKVMNSAVEVLNLTDQVGNLLNGVTSSGGDMTSAHF